MADQDVSFNNIITGDENWCFCRSYSLNISHESVNLNNFLGNENSKWKRTKEKSCWRFSLMLRVSSTMNLFQKGVL
jgi:hypothetical protein